MKRIMILALGLFLFAMPVLADEKFDKAEAACSQEAMERQIPQNDFDQFMQECIERQMAEKPAEKG